MAFSKVCDFTSNINVELQTMSYGLDLAWNLWSSCKFDFLSAIKFIKERVPHHPYAAIVNYIRSMLTKN